VDGLLPCRVVPGDGAHANVLEALCAHYPRVAREDWLRRFAAGHVFDDMLAPIAPETPWRPRQVLHYYREFSEDLIPAREAILHVDENLVVVDKPHFLPVIPAGRYLRETLVARVIARLGNAELSPLHRLDRATAGLVLFGARRETRAIYQALFRDRAIVKRYECLAPALPALRFPLERHSRIARCADGYRNEEVPGDANASTHIDVLEAHGPIWRYALTPRSGKMHQLRVHMAALGAAIVNDPWYPVAREHGPDDYARPLKLLARGLSFVDPVNGQARDFVSALQL
jgi:tRNA pseudouridine32 synthase/23S rRNA pseudouridine746 synthase